MQERYLKNVIEAALLAAGRPLSVAELVEMFDAREQPEAGEVRAVLEELESDYTDRGIELKEVASGFRIQIRHTISEAVSRLWQERPQRYSRALLETLALIAYRQPITRAEIEEVRGVTVNPNIVRTLFERNWIRVVGHREVPGHPELLGTTREFLDYFNLKNLDDLPSLAELRDMDNLGVQLELPGEVADLPAESEPSDLADEGGVSAAVDEEMADGEEAAPDASEAPGMVARGVEDG
jgi:segregation and condensation protein B